MDTRKLILHIDGDSGVQSRIELEDFGTTHYIDGDTDMVAEMVKRHNAYPAMLEKLHMIEAAYNLAIKSTPANLRRAITATLKDYETELEIRNL